MLELAIGFIIGVVWFIKGHIGNACEKGDKNNNKEQRLFLLFFALLYLYIPHIITTKLKPV